MSFQFNEKMLAHDRALITRNLKFSDLSKTTHDSYLKFKPGMLHYVAETKSLYLSIDPTPYDGTDREFIEMLSEFTLNEKLLNYVHKDGGVDNSITGQLHLTTVDKAPFVISSNIRVDKLNADLIDDRHVDDTQTSTGYLWTAKKITDELTNLQTNSTTAVLQDNQPTTPTNVDAYWFEIISTKKS